MSREFDPLSWRPIEVPVPRRDQVSSFPLIYDTRTQAFRIHFPGASPPNDRQVAAQSCNVMELYLRLDKSLQNFQCEFVTYPDKAKVIHLPYQIITPKRGWMLNNLTKQITYQITSVKMSQTEPRSFTGDIVVNSTNIPDPGDELEWVDPLGIVDGEAKVVRFMADEQVGDILDPRSSGGELEGSKKKPFTYVVTHELIRREPGSITGKAFAPQKEIKPRYRQTTSDPLDPRNVIEVKGQWMDLIIRFRCIALNPYEADRLASWLETFFSLYTGVLELLGVQKILFWQQKTDREDTRITGKMYSRPLEYYFRLEHLSLRRLPVMKSFDIATRIIGLTDPLTSESSEPSQSRWDLTHDTSGNYKYGSVSIGDSYGQTG